MLRRMAYSLALRTGFVVRKTTKPTDLNLLFDFLRPKGCKFPLVRLGSDRDGGYLVPEIEDQINYLWSAGVADDVNLELSFVAGSDSRRVFLVDGSIPYLPSEHPQFTFAKSYLGNSGSFENEVSLTEWLSSNGYMTGRSMLSMDIEGGEYQVFNETPREVFDAFDLIVMELHGMENCFDPLFFSSNLRPMLRKLDNFDCIHLHINNALPPVRGPRGLGMYPLLEMTLAHKRLGITENGSVSLPHALDVDNVTNRPPAEISVLNWL